MKAKLYITIICTGLALTISSCKKFLDLPAKNQRAIETMADLKSVLAGYLYGLKSTNPIPMAGTGQLPIINEEQQMMFESYSDNIDFEKAMPSFVNPPTTTIPEKFYADKFLWNDHATSKAIWDNYYTTVGFLNALIDQMEDLRDGTAAERKQVEGEMLMHRSYYLLKLLQYFAPYQDNALGIPMYLHTGLEVVGIPLERKSQSEVYAQIIADLNKVVSYLDEARPDTEYNIFYNSRFVHHLLSQVYWFKSESAAKAGDDYALLELHAKAASEGVEQYIPSTVVDLQNVRQGLDTNYPSYFHIGRGSIQNLYGSPFAYIGFSPNNIPVAQDFLNLFDTADLRKGLYFANGTISTGWPDGKANGQKKIQIHLFTPEEALLMLSEAYLKNGKADLALSTLNSFKTFRKAPAVQSGLAPQQLLQEIVDERRREFFAKLDMRWLDLKRYANKDLKRTLSFFKKSYTLDMKANGYQYALPIPVTELQENPAIKPNEGWEVINY